MVKSVFVVTALLLVTTASYSSAVATCDFRHQSQKAVCEDVRSTRDISGQFRSNWLRIAIRNRPGSTLVIPGLAPTTIDRMTVTINTVCVCSSFHRTWRQRYQRRRVGYFACWQPHARPEWFPVIRGTQTIDSHKCIVESNRRTMVQWHQQHRLSRL